MNMTKTIIAIALGVSLGFCSSGVSRVKGFEEPLSVEEIIEKEINNIDFKTLKNHKGEPLTREEQKAVKKALEKFKEGLQ